MGEIPSKISNFNPCLSNDCSVDVDVFELRSDVWRYDVVVLKKTKDIYKMIPDQLAIREFLREKPCELLCHADEG